MENENEKIILLNTILPRRGEKEKIYGAYILYHCKSRKMYIGSGKLYFRLHHHRTHLRDGNHHNKELQDAYNDDDVISFYVIQITNNAEEAFNIEQSFLDMYFDTGMLFNSAKNARKSGIGRIVSDEERKYLRKLKIDIPRSENVKEKIRTARAKQLACPEAVERMRIGNLKRSKQVIINGTTHDSLRAAARTLGLDRYTIVSRIKNQAYPFWNYA